VNATLSIHIANVAAPPIANTPVPAPVQLQVRSSEKPVARAFIDQAITQGSMTKGNILQLRALILNVDPDSQQDLRLRLVRALNQDKLKLEDNELPF
jgi:hypothetical protein